MEITSSILRIDKSLKSYLHNKQQLIGNKVYVIGVIILTLFIYIPVFTHNFQFDWDDQWVVMNDYTEGGFNKENILSIITEFYHGQYSPVNQVYYLVLYELFGYNSILFHFANLLIHLLNILLVYTFIKKLICFSDVLPEKSVVRISCLVALLFAIHPLMAEPVSWMAASKCMIYASFYLIALVYYLDYLKTPRIWNYLKVILLFILSFGAKEVAVTFPVCLLLIDYFVNKDLKSSSTWFIKLPFFCLSIIFILVTFYSQAYNREGILSDQLYYRIDQNIVFAAYSVIEYVIKTFLPIRLNYLYPFPALPGDPIPLYMYLYPIILVFNLIVFRKHLKNKAIFFGIAFYLIQISVASNIIPTSRFAILADRYMYLPIIGIFFTVAYGLDWFLTHRPKLSQSLTIMICIYVATLSIYSHQRSKVWENSNSLKLELKENIRSRSDFKKLEKQFK